jgi:glycerol-3-phosphate acyltransferase PlsY
MFFILVALWRYISLGSILGALTMPIWLYLTGHSTFMILPSLVMSLLITFQHRGNIQRLIQGNERRWEKAKLH